MESTTGTLDTEVYFLARSPLYLVEKPYSLRFTPPPGFPRANVQLESHNISVVDVRPMKRDLSMKTNGFAIMEFTTKMTHEDFDDEQKVTDIYLSELAESLREYLGAQKVQFFEHTVRKRHETFPISTGAPYKYNQPTSMAHVDTTLSWAQSMACKLNPNGTNRAQGGRLQCVNIWKPIRGPVRDWPLAMCDPATVENTKDYEPCDLVYPDYVVENRQLYFRPEQRWVYMSDQQPSEAWVFIQSDTDGDSMSVPHTSFPNPLATADDAPRESIEARALVYYA